MEKKGLLEKVLYLLNITNNHVYILSTHALITLQESLYKEMDTHSFLWPS